MYICAISGAHNGIDQNSLTLSGQRQYGLLIICLCILYKYMYVYKSMCTMYADM